MTNQSLNLHRALEKYIKITQEFCDGAIDGSISPYHLKRKNEALVTQRDKLLDMISKDLQEPETNIEIIETQGRKLKFVPKTLLTTDKMYLFIGKHLEVWSKPPHNINLAYQVFKPLEFREEYEKILSLSDSGMLVYEELIE